MYIKEIGDGSGELDTRGTETTLGTKQENDFSTSKNNKKSEDKIEQSTEGMVGRNTQPKRKRGRPKGSDS